MKYRVTCDSCGINQVTMSEAEAKRIKKSHDEIRHGGTSTATIETR